MHLLKNNILRTTFKNIIMVIIKLDDRYTRPASIAASALYFIACLVFFTPIEIPHKITICTSILTLASLWLCPWQMTLALLFSTLGDHFGSCHNFMAQMGFFALGHIWFIIYFIGRYFTRVEKDSRLTGKAKGYLAMVVFCTLTLLAVVFSKIVPEVPQGIMKFGVCIYALLISTMLTSAMLQRSSLFALGAILFVFSDFILAWNKFVEPIPGRHYLVLVPYFMAQWLLFIRATKFRIGPEMRLLRF